MIKSAVACTTEIDDLQLAAKELIAGIHSKISLQAHSCGILFCDFEAQGAVLAQYLEEAFSFPVIGCSSIAVLNHSDGYRDMSAMFTVLTADDCFFSTALSEPLTLQSGGSPAADAFLQAKSALPCAPKLAYIFVPGKGEVMFDRCLDAISEIDSETPIIGGVPSADGDYDKFIIANHSLTTNQMAVLLISGNLRPITTLANVVRRFSDKTGVITRADHEVIYTVDDVSFYDFCKTFGPETQKLIQNPRRMFFQQHPLLIENAAQQTGDLPFVRICDSIDTEDGSGRCFADVPAGATVSLSVLEREDISQTARTGLEDLLKKIQEKSTDDYTYSTILCISCAARHTTMNPHYDTEGNIIRDTLPENLSLCGFYSYGELCPTSVNQGKFCNRLHNASIVYCAI